MSTTGNAPTTFSSSHMRERDKIIREKHDKELSALNSKINRLRYSNDDLMKQIHDVEERARRLSNALGFEDFVNAQVFISTGDQGVSYKECFEQVDSLTAELDVANFQVESLKAQLALADQERQGFKAKLDASRKMEQEARKSSRSETAKLKVKTSELQQQYNDLRNKYDRATDFYKADYKKWRKFNAWLFSKHEDVKNMSGAIRATATIMRKKRKLQEMLNDESLSNDTDCPPPLGGFTNPYLEEDEDQVTAQHVRNIEPRPFPVSPLVLSPPATRPNTPASPGLNAAAKPKPLIGSKKTTNMPLHSPSVFLDLSTGPKSIATRASVVYKPVPDAVYMREPESSPSREGIIQQNPKDDASLDEVFAPSSEFEEDARDSESLPSASKAAEALPSVPCCSDSEQDLGSRLQSYGGSLLTASQPLSPAVKTTKMPALTYSSDTEPDTQWTGSPTQHTATLPTPHPLPPVFKMPKVTQLACSSDTERDIQQLGSPLQRHNLPLPTPKSLARPAPVFRPGKRDNTNDGHNGHTEPPHKIRRVGVIQTPKRSLSSYRSKTSPRSGSSRKAVAGNDENRVASHSIRTCKKGENKENAMLLAVSTPFSSAKVSNTPSQQDYSAFKGRGRYAKDVNSTTNTINAAYTIDSSRNGGVEHPYDEVVRRKEDRKKMDAGDCECCHEYYEAVGPLPSLMQPPLWRSPETKKKKACPTRSTGQHKRHVSDSHALLSLDSSFNTKKSSILTDSQDPPFSQFGSNTDKHHSGIEDHKRLISRHRHHWARAVTPPGYWDIGFPSTQETEKINEKAKEMHRKKQFEVDRSVRAGEGKYRRR